jgi:hypothetical protein
MIKSFAFKLIIVLSIVFVAACDKNKEPVVPVAKADPSKPSNTYDAEMAINWFNLHLYLIKNTPGFAAPVAARSLNYSAITLYESLVHGMKGHKSLSGQLNGLKALPLPDTTKEYNWGLVASTAQYTILKEMFLTTGDKNQLAIDSVKKYFEVRLKTGTPDVVIDRSIRYGASVAAAINEFSKQDGGPEGYLKNFPSSYVIPVGIGFWKASSTSQKPMLPYWGENKTTVKANGLDFIEDPVPFSFDKNKLFFLEGKKIFDISIKLTAEQKSTAKYYEGGEQTFTTAGHHFNIAKQLLINEKAKLDKVAEVMAKIGMALNDSYINSWKAKYSYNMMRPSTFIKQTITNDWNPYLSNTPFPEYSSSNSTSVGATVEILENVYGKAFAFEDKTFDGKIANRKFTTLDQFGLECSNSSIYGGVQFEFSCKNGYTHGRAIAKNVLKLKFKK